MACPLDRGAPRSPPWSDVPPTVAAQEIERRVAAQGTERHRKRRPFQWCPGRCYFHDSDFWCVGCRRWRCFCTGGGDESRVTLSLCADCWLVYRRAREPHELALVHLLTNRLERLVPPELVRAALPSALRRIVAPRHAYEQRRRRIARLGWRTVQRMTLRQQLGLLIVTWPSANVDLSGFAEDLRRAALEPSGWQTYGDGKHRRVPARDALERWAEVFELVFCSPAPSSDFSSRHPPTDGSCSSPSFAPNGPTMTLCDTLLPIFRRIAAGEAPPANLADYIDIVPEVLGVGEAARADLQRFLTELASALVAANHDEGCVMERAVARLAAPAHGGTK